MVDIINRKLISAKIDKGETLKLSFKYVNEKVLMILNSVIARLLAKNDQIYLLNSVVTILREIIINALKANAMRYPKPPAGEAYCRIEAPRGDLGFFIVSDGTDKPFRVKIRASSFSNLAVLPRLVKGLKVADIVAVSGSLDVVMGEIDR